MLYLERFHDSVGFNFSKADSSPFIDPLVGNQVSDVANWPHLCGLRLSAFFLAFPARCFLQNKCLNQYLLGGSALHLVNVALEALCDLRVVVHLLQLQKVLEGSVVFEQVGNLLELVEGLLAGVVQDELLEGLLQVAEEVAAGRRLSASQQVLQVVVLLYVGSSN